STILSAQGEVSVPTGNKTKGFGTGITTFETFAALGQTLPRSSFIQIQTGFELPTDTAIVSNAYFFRGVVGKAFTPNGRAGRAWIPMVEFLSERELENGAATDWDIVPEVQVTLSKRQHIRANFGVRTPLNHREGRSTQLAFYVLWDFFDGGLREGW
ncbi:MAG TPA: cytochrome c, partial [Terriglobia bacterium]|nr:cytochrome c [Terriglobia bacterium]